MTNSEAQLPSSSPLHSPLPARPTAMVARSAPRESNSVQGTGCLAIVLLLVAPIASGLAWWFATPPLAVMVALLLGSSALLLGIASRVRRRQLQHRESRRLERMSPEAKLLEDQEVADYEGAVSLWREQQLASGRFRLASGGIDTAALVVEQLRVQALPAGQPADEAAARRRRELEDEAARLALPKRSDGDELVVAFAGLGGLHKARLMWLETNERVIERAGRELDPMERVLHVATSLTMSADVEAIIVTDMRLGIIRSRGPEWISRTRVQGASTKKTSSGQQLVAETKGGTRRWRQLEPAAAAGVMAATLDRPCEPLPSGQRPAEATSQTARPAGQYGAAIASTDAKFLGGEFVGNTVRGRSALGRRLDSGRTVKIELTDDDFIVIRTGVVELARYQVNDAGLVIDDVTTVGRGIRKGRLAATVAATLFVAPVAALGAAASTARRVQSNFTLTLDDGADYGVFSVTDAAVGQQLAATQRGKSVTSASESAPQSQPHEGSLYDRASEALGDLERLVALRDSGAIDEMEFLDLKGKLLT